MQKLTIISLVLLAVMYICSCKKDNPASTAPITANELKAEVMDAFTGKDSLSSFAAMFKDVELSNADVATGITLFAPINQAFTNKATAIINTGRGVLMAVATPPGIMAVNTVLPDNSDVRDYIVKGKMEMTDLTDGKVLTAISGKQLVISVNNGVLYINGVQLSGRNIGTGTDYLLFTISAFINDSKQLKISGFSDEKTIPGWLLTIYGKNFSVNAADNIVKINGKQALVHTATTDSLLVTVPVGATTGVVTVAVKDKTVTSTQTLSIMQTHVGTIAPWKSLNCEDIQGMAIDQSDNIYFTDPGNNRVFRFNPYKNGGTEFSSYAPLIQSQTDVNGDGIVNAQDKVFAFDSPWAIAVDKQGQVFVNSVPLAGNGTGATGGAIFEMSLDAAGSLSQLQLWAGGNNKGMTLEGPKETLSLLYPTVMAFDGSGNLLFNQHVANTPFALEQINSSGLASRLLTQTEFKSVDPNVQRDVSIYGIVADRAGGLYFSDVTNARIWKYSTAGLRVLAGNNNNTAKDGLGTAAQFGSPFGITIDQKGNLYICDNDYTHNTVLIRMINPEGVVTTIAGGKNNNISKDGIGNNAVFNGANTIVIDSKGVLYVGSDDGTVRKLTNE